MLLMKEAKDFCLNTYTHGFRLIVLPERKLFERILWLIITLIASVSAVTLSWLSWITITKEPRLTVADSPSYAIWNYPFPAVTVCNFNKISKKRAYQFANNIKDPGDFTVEDLAQNLRLLYHLIDFVHLEIPQENLTRLQNVLDRNGVVVNQLIEYLAPSCKEMMQRCTWKGQRLPCDKLFEQTRTPDGFCCSFNYLARKNHTFGSARQLVSSKYRAQSKPKRVAATGYQTALESVINCLPDDYFATYFTSFGYRVVIHYPYNFPDGTALNMIQPTNSIMFIGVRPFLYITDTKIDSMPTSERKCYFQHERQLLNFEYSYYNCISECRLNITIELCNCTPFYYYFGRNFNGLYSRICNLKDMPCLSKNADKIRSSVPGQTRNMDIKEFKSDWLQKATECPCLPDCYYCSYKIEGTSGRFNKKYVSNKPTLFGGLKFTNHSVIRVFFDDLVATKYKTSVRHYWHTLLGFFGGLLGLFSGFSIVSLIEMIFFFTIRPILDFIVQVKVKNRNKFNQPSFLK